MTITAAFERITPAKAERILQVVHPRQQGRNAITVIDTYARQMKQGHWDENVAQTISIDKTGALVDGWHRLHAVIKSGATVKFLIARGVDPDAYCNYDSGTRRTLAFRMGVSKDTSSIIAMVLKLSLYGLVNGPVTREQFDVASDFILNDIETFDQSVSGKRVARISSAPVRTAAILQAKAYPAKRDQIYQAYSNLVLMNFVDAPRSMSVLYKRLIDDNPRQFMVFALAWKAFNPTKFSAQKIQINDMQAVLKDARDSVLSELTGAVRTDEVVEAKRAVSRAYTDQHRRRGAQAEARP